MKQTIGLTEFRNAFENMGRKENFSREGLRALFNHITQLEDDMCEEVELDVISLCCDYTESTLKEVLADYPSIESLEDLQDQTTVIIVDEENGEDNPTIIFYNF